MSPINRDASAAESPSWLPESARRILLVRGATPDDWGGNAPAEVAEEVARHRPRTLLVSTLSGSESAEAALGVEGRPGLSELVRGDNRAGEVAVKPRGRSFLFIPAGASALGIDQLWEAPAFRHLVEAAGRGGTLLLHVPEADVAYLCHQSAAPDAPKFDGIVLLGDSSLPAGEALDVRVLARVEAEASPSPASGGPDARARRTSGLYRPSGTPAIVAGAGARKSPRTRFEKLIDEVRKQSVRGAGGVAAVWLVAVLAVWLVLQGLSGWPAFEDDFDAPVASSETVGVPADGDREPGEPRTAESAGADGGAEPVAAGSQAGDPSGEGRQAPADSEIEPGVALPYSVLVASHVAYEDAAAERDRLNESGNLLTFIAPTPIRGRLYFRVFAGALEDRVQAAELMQRLVQAGSKERERDWDMRPVNLAFAIRDFASEEEAGDERQRLHDAGLPAYVLAVGDTTGAVYRLYSGAFESEGAAGPTDTLLSAAGQNATLVTRRGEPR